MNKIKTYSDIYRIIKTGKCVVSTSYYGNKRRYFIDENNEPCEQFGICAHSISYGINEDNNSDVNPLFDYEIFDSYEQSFYNIY